MLVNILTIFAMKSSLNIYPNIEIYSENDSVGLMFKFIDIQSTQIIELMKTLNISELQLQFGKGLSPILDKNWMTAVSPVGANLLVKTDTSLNRVFSILSGLFCASLNSIESVSLFKGFYHGKLPQETVCTENLTPFLKLLPCNNRMGLVELLNPLALFDGYYYGMSLTSISTPSGIKTDITIQSVFKRKDEQNLVQLLRLSKSEITICAASSLDITYSPSKEFNMHDRLNHLTLDLKNIDVKPIKSNVKLEKYHHLQYSSWLGGFGDDSGKLITVLENSDSEPLTIEYYEQIPWYFRLYLHTSQWRSSLRSSNDEFLNSFHFLPSKDRIQPAVLIYNLTIPGKARLTYSIEFEKGFLRYKEYKPDAHRGLDFG
eukprot:NODE_88_length_21932_cov_0.317867.p5 type:complete len:374 gc:universal NODE_88_length_21932_cov_0.317867:1698-577(-)